MGATALTILKIIGQALLPLITGKAIRAVVLWPFKKLASKTKTPEDDNLVRLAEEDAGLVDPESKSKE